MLKIIKHGNTVHTYKCGRCGCIFIADNSEIKDGDILMQCPECRFYILEHDIIDDKKNKSRDNQCAFMLESQRA